MQQSRNLKLKIESKNNFQLTNYPKISICSVHSISPQKNGKQKLLNGQFRTLKITIEPLIQLLTFQQILTNQDLAIANSKAIPIQIHRIGDLFA